MNRRIGAATLALGLGVLAGPVMADTGDPVVTAELVAKVLQDKGYKAEIAKDATGDPLVRSATDGSGFAVVFYGCNHTTRCTAVQYQAAYHVTNGITPARINTWNKEHRFLRGFVDTESDPTVEYDVDFDRGAVRERLITSLDIWVAELPKFRKFIAP